MRRGFSMSIFLLCLLGCSSKQKIKQPSPPALFVLKVQTADRITYQSYPAFVEGISNVEIRPQVSGILKKIYADEGSYVEKGQALFRIDEAPFKEQLNQVVAEMHAAEGALTLSLLEIDRLIPLVQNNVVSDHQLRVAQAAYQVAQFNLQQAKALVGSARINLDYCLIKAPVSGYLGRILKKQGSLLNPQDVQPMTTLSDVHQVHVYFALAETDFIRFRSQYPGATLRDKLAGLPPVLLMLSDRSIYGSHGKVDMVDGQFDKKTGAITLRASFPNRDGVLRSGNTGRVQLPLKHTNTVLVPQAATVEAQDKVFVFMVDDSNKVNKKPLTIIGKSGDSYLVQDGVASGDKIVVEGLGHLQEGTLIQPRLLNSNNGSYSSSN